MLPSLRPRTANAVLGASCIPVSVLATSVHDMALSELEHNALQIEDLRGRVRSDAIYAVGLTVTTHSRMVLGLVDRLDAIEAYPMLCARVRRLRDARARVRRAG